VIELFTDKCPKTCDNFKALCTASHGMSKLDKKKALHYKNCAIHRIVKDFIAQGGDITRNDGSGGDSIYNGKFNDEKNGLKLKFEDFGRKGKGVVAMANSGKNSNTSQFFVTLTDDSVKLGKMNGKYVVFGHVVDGWETLDLMNIIGTDSGVPKESTVIFECGLIDL
jgi:cyclophilin family peptidyl-prolyl cis-trans isomerase